MMNKINQTQKILLGSLLFTVLCAVVFAGFAYMLQNDAASLREAVSRVANKEQEEQRNIMASNVFDESVEERAELSQYVLTEDRLIDFISELENIARQQQVDLEITQIKDNTPKKAKFASVKDFIVGVKFSASQERLQKMIAIFETMPYHGHVETLNISRRQNDWEGTAVLHLTVIAYDE